MMYSVEFDGILSEKYRIYATSRPDIPCPSYDLTEISIPGRDGVLHIDNRRYESITIQIEFNYIGDIENWAKIWRVAKRWLSARDTTLKLSDDSDYFYKVYRVNVDTNERVTNRIGRFKASFVCHPYMFLTQGENSMGVEKSSIYLADVDGRFLCDINDNPILTTYWRTEIVNAFDECHPIYEITGNGYCEMSVNGNWLRVNIVDKTFVDTELQVTYREDGEKINQTVKGRYSDMWLKHGSNTIELDSRFELSLIPNWREL